MGNTPPKTGLIHELRAYGHTAWRVLRRPASRALTLAAFVLLCLSAYLFKPAVRPTLILDACIVLAGGSLTFWLALFLNRYGKKQLASVIPEPPPTLEDTRPSAASTGKRYVRPNIILILFGVAAFLILIEINTGIFGIAALQTATVHVQFILFILGLIGVTLGCSCIPFPRRIFSPSLRSGEGAWGRGYTEQLVTGNFILLIAIIILAFALRYAQLGTAVHYWIDEIHFSNAVLNLRLSGDGVKLLLPINAITAFPWLFSYMQSWGVGLLGRNLEGLRLISVVVGTLGIPALYLLARELLDRKTALLAALLLTVFPPHIQFSRIGLNNIVDPLFGTLALAFLVRGFRHNRPLDFALGGAALGLTQYFYEGGRLFFPLLILSSLAWFTLVKPRFYPEPSDQPSSALPLTGNSKLATGSFSSLITFFLTALLIALPLYIALAANQQPFDPRFQTVGVGGSYWMRVTQFGKPQTLPEHLFLPFLVYVFQPEIALYYGGEQAMLLPYVVPFVFVGVLVLLAYWRTPGVILVGWVILASMGNMLLTESAIYARYVVVFPALALLAAVGIRSLAVLLWPKKSLWRTAVVLSTALVLAVGQITYFFGPHLTRYNQQLRQTFDAQDAIFRSVGSPWGTQVHIIAVNTPGQVFLSGIANFLTDGLWIFVTAPADLTAAYVNGLSRSVDHAFFVEPDDQPSIDLLKLYFRLDGPFPSPYNVPINRQLMLYYARADVPAG